MNRQKHQGEIKLHRKILTIDDVNKMLELIKHIQYTSEVGVTLVFAGGEKISNANPEILQSAEVKSKYVKELCISAKIFDDTKKCYEDRIECNIDIGIKTETDFFDFSKIEINSNDETLYHLYYSRFEVLVKAIRSQAFPCFLNYTWIYMLFSIASALFFWIYVLMRTQPKEAWFMPLFLASVLISYGVFGWVKEMYPNNEIVLGEEYFYPPKNKKRILIAIFVALIGSPIVDFIVQLIWR